MGYRIYVSVRAFAFRVLELSCFADITMVC